MRTLRFSNIQRIVGLLLMVFSTTLLPPAVIGMVYGDGGVADFLAAFGLVLGSGALLWLPVRGARRELRVRDGFLVVVAFWLALGFAGAVPFMLAATPDMTVTDSVFESISGLTTTGATVLTELDQLPRAILFYRQQLQWLGGMGIIVLAVAILPMLGIGGMQLYRAETPGPIKDRKITPRITETAKALWLIYLSLTVGCAIAYGLAGMDWFDAVGHAFSTIAIGGFSTHDASLGHYRNAWIEGVAVVFMVLAGVNFSLHFVAWRGKTVRGYWRDPELRAYLSVLGAVSLIATAYLLWTHTYDDWGEALLKATFQAVSIGTTTGFTVADYSIWPSFLPVMLLFASFVGACAGSTGGGLKVIRCVLLFRQGVREIQALVHPNAVIPVKVGGKVMSERLINAIWGFFALYVASFVIIMLAMMATGLDQITAFSATAATMNNLGPGLGEVAAGFAPLSDAAKWLSCFAMLLGRLEIFTLLVLFTPTFWIR